MRSVNVVATVVLIAVMAVVVAAHGHVHKGLFGTATSVSDDLLAMKDRDGRDVEIKLTGQTRVPRGSSRVTLDEVKAGERVVAGVDSDKAPSTAVEIPLGTGS